MDFIYVVLYLAGINAKVYVCAHLVPHTDVADAAYIIKAQISKTMLM